MRMNEVGFSSASRGEIWVDGNIQIEVGFSLVSHGKVNFSGPCKLSHTIIPIWQSELPHTMWCDGSEN
jgi:hypothetical protein